MRENRVEKTKVLSFLRIWCILVLYSIPISYRIFPSIGMWIHKLLLPLNEPVCGALFGVDIQKTYWISDSAGFYSMAILLAFVALFLIIMKPIFRFFIEKIKAKLHLKEGSFYFLNSQVILNYILAYFLLRYGLDKIIGEQFYFPAPNTLHTELGNLSKDLLYWSTMGASKNYNYFMALIEILGGLLLLWKSTRFLGTLMAFGIMLNVFATNIGFDISVKFLSGSLLITSTVLLMHYKAQLKVLIGWRHSFINQTQLKPKLSVAILKIIVLLLFAIELGLPLFQGGEYLFEAKTYTVKSHVGNSKFIDLSSAKRLHVHREGYLIIESTNQTFQSAQIIPTNNGFRTNKLNFAINTLNNEISWTENGAEISVKIKEKNLNSMKLAQDDHHWFVEDMLK